MSDEKLISDIIEREGGEKQTNDPQDRGGRTEFGISEKSNPEAWKDGVVTRTEAEAIYRQRYIEGPGFDQLPERLKQVMVDFGVTSGPRIATRTLQFILGIEQDGLMGSETRQAISGWDESSLVNLVVLERLRLIRRIVAKRPNQQKWYRGWVLRAVEFLVP